MAIEKLPSGKYRAVVTHGRGNRRNSTPMATRAEALMAEARLKVEMGAAPPKVDRMTVRELLIAHLDQHDYSPTTRDDYQRVLRRLPAGFLGQQVADVGTWMVDDLYRSLSASGMSPHRVRRVHTLLSSAYGRAIRYRWATTNPTIGASPPALPSRRKMTTAAPDTLRRILDLAAEVNPKLPIYYRLAYDTGARRGELVGLRWEDLDGNRLTIRRSLANARVWPHRYIIKATKTGSERTITLAPSTLAALESIPRRQPLGVHP